MSIVMDHCRHVASYYLTLYAKTGSDHYGNIWAEYYWKSRVDWRNYKPNHGTMEERSPNPIVPR